MINFFKRRSYSPLETEEMMRSVEVFKFALPVRYREEGLGDMREMIYLMCLSQMSKAKIYTLISCHMFTLLFYSQKFRLDEYFKKKRKRK